MRALWYYYVNCQQLCQWKSMKSLEQFGAPGRKVWLRRSRGPLGVQSLGGSAFVQDGRVQGFHGDCDADTQGSHQPPPFSSCQMSQTVSTWPRWDSSCAPGGEGWAPIRIKPPGFRIMLPQLTSPGRVTHQVCAPMHLSPKSWLSPTEPTTPPKSFLHRGTWNHHPMWHPGENRRGFLGQAGPNQAAQRRERQKPTCGLLLEAPPGRLCSQALTRGPQLVSSSVRIHSDLYLSDSTANMRVFFYLGGNILPLPRMKILFSGLITFCICLLYDRSMSYVYASIWTPIWLSIVKDKEAWSAAVHGLTKSWTQLNVWMQQRLSKSFPLFWGFTRYLPGKFTFQNVS